MSQSAPTEAITAVPSEAASTAATIEERVAALEAGFSKLPEILSAQAAQILNSVDEKLTRMLDTLIAQATAKAQPPMMTTAPVQQGNTGWGWVRDLVENPLVQKMLGAGESSGGLEELAGLKKQWDSLFMIRYKKSLETAIRKEMGSLGIPSHDIVGEHTGS